MEMRTGLKSWAAVPVVVCALIVSISCASVAELQRVYVIVNLPEAPIQIAAFGEYKYEDATHISSVVEYKNGTSRDIEAAAITMIYFDAFNERQDGVRGITTDLLPAYQQFNTTTWSVYGTPSFVKTAMAFVSAVRFMDGEVWRADVSDVLEAAARLLGLGFLSGTETLEVVGD